MRSAIQVIDDADGKNLFIPDDQIPEHGEMFARFSHPKYPEANTEAIAIRAYKVSLNPDDRRDPLRMVYFVKTRSSLRRQKSRHAAYIEAKRMNFAFVKEAMERENKIENAEKAEFEKMASLPIFGAF